MSNNHNRDSMAIVHPALAFTSEHAYVGQMLPHHARENRLCLIRDDGRLIDCNERVLRRNGLQLVHNDFNFEQRWSYTGITQFTRGQAPTVERSELLETVRGKFTEYIELQDERLYDFLALWNIGTYLFPLFNTYPYVYVGGISQSGKTKLLTLCSCISFNSIPSANMTTACIYRLINNAKCSLFIDETEHLSSHYRAEDFRNILLSGYREGLHTYRNRRTPDSNFVVEALEVYSPKMLANIEGLEDVLESRCITIIMQRGLNRDITNREVQMTDPIWQQTRDMIYPFLMRNWRTLRQTYVELQNDTTLSCRNWELWKPMLAMAQFFDSDELLTEITALAVGKAEETQRDDLETDEFILVETLLSTVTEDGYYSLGDIRDDVIIRLGNGNWLTERSLGRLLRRLAFNRRRRLGTGYEYFFRLSQVRSLAETLGITAISEHSELSEHTTEEGTNNTSQETDTEGETA